jgi:hypothetical protein
MARGRARSHPERLEQQVKKNTKAPSGAKCTSTASGGVLKCVLQGEHDVHSTRIAGRKGAQYSTWCIGQNGRVTVVSFTTSGKQQGKWDEDPPEVARKPLALDDEPQDDEADASALAALEEADDDDASRTIERCGAPRIGITRCQLFERHDGEHFALLHGLGHAWTSGCDPNIWDICGAKWSRHPSEKGPTKLPKDRQTVCARPDEHNGKHRGLNHSATTSMSGKATTGGCRYPQRRSTPDCCCHDERDEAAKPLATRSRKPRSPRCSHRTRHPDPSLADACPKCGFELGQHTGKKCPKAVKSARQKHAEPEVSVEIEHASLTVSVDDGPPVVVWESFSIGQRVQLAKRRRGAVETGTVRDLVDTQRGKRALVAWAGGEQFVDLVELVVAPTESAPPVKFTDLCLKCGLAKHAGKCATAKKPETAAQAEAARASC